MGNRHRLARKVDKAQLRRLGWREDEFGDLVKRATKAEARRTLIGRALVRIERESQIMDIIARRAHDDVCALEDARTIRELEFCCGGLRG